jgi:hypothetical protein
MAASSGVRPDKSRASRSAVARSAGRECRDAVACMVHHHEHPVSTKDERDSHRNRSTLHKRSFACPRTVSQDGPDCGFGWYRTARMRRTTSLFMGMPKARVICCAIRGHPQVGFRCFMSTTAAMTSGLGPFGPGLLGAVDENSRRYFRGQRSMEAQERGGFQDDGGTDQPARAHEQRAHAATTRSARRRLGARRLERLRISSCCLTSTDSATTARTPPGPASRATVAKRWRTRAAKSRIAQS